jgi:hypothetical protein
MEILNVVHIILYYPYYNRKNIKVIAIIAD